MVNVEIAENRWGPVQHLQVIIPQLSFFYTCVYSMHGAHGINGVLLWGTC